MKLYIYHVTVKEECFSEGDIVSSGGRYWKYQSHFITASSSKKAIMALKFFYGESNFHRIVVEDKAKKLGPV